MKITTRTTLAEIVSAIKADCFHDALIESACCDCDPDAPTPEKALRSAATEIKQAALRGCLVWTKSRITTTDASRIDVRSFEDVDSDEFRDAMRDAYLAADRRRGAS